MKNTLMSLLMAGAISLGLVACSPDVQAPGGQPVQQASHSGGDMLMGGFMGYLLGRSMSTPPQPTTHVVERTIVKEAQAKPVVSEHPKLHSGQTLIKPTVPATPNIYSKPATSTYLAPARNSYSSPSRSFSSGRR